MKKRILALAFCAWAFGSASATTMPFSGDTVVCEDETVTYYAPTAAGATYAWNVTGGNPLGSLSGDTLLVWWPNAGSGVVQVTVTHPDNSQTFYYLNISIHPKPYPVISHPPYPTCPTEHGQEGPGTGQPVSDRPACEKVCKYATITYSTPLNTGSTYQWAATGHQSISGTTTNTVTVTWDGSPYGSLTVYETNQWGCVDSATMCIEKVDIPNAAFTHPSTACKGSTVYFANTSTGATSYEWDFGDGGTSTLENPSHPYTNAGSYTITLVAFNDCHCSDTFQSTIIIDSLPGPDIICPSTVCAGTLSTYSTSASGCTYSWVVQGGTIVGASNQQSVNVSWGAGQLGMLGLVVSGCGGLCTDTTWAQIPIIPMSGTIKGSDEVCPGECHTYSLPDFSGTSYSWNLNSGSCGTISDSTICNEVEICYPPFYYPCHDTLTVSYHNSLLGCGGTASMVIRIRPELTIYGLGNGCANSPSGFGSSVACNWSVSPSGPVISGSPSTSVTIDWQNNPGTYLVTAVAVNPNDVCNDTATIQVKVVPPPPPPVITGDTLVCTGKDVQYCATGSGTINWIVQGGTPSSGMGNCISVNWNPSGPYSISAYSLMTSSPFCTSDTAMLNVNAISSIPSPLISGDTMPCANGTSTYACSLSYPAGTDFSWSLAPSNAGAIISGQGSPNITIEWGNNAPLSVALWLKTSVCSAIDSASIPILLNPVPTPSVNQTGTLCSGGSTQLSVSGGTFTAYIWSGPGGYTASGDSVTITQEGLYKVTVSDANGCTAQSQINVQASGDPVASISAQGPTQYCIGSGWSVDLCALGNPNYSYAWSNAATSQCVTITTPGTYTVTVTDVTTGCTSSSNLISVNEDSCGGSGGGTQCSPGGSISFTHSGCNPKVFTNTSVNGGSFSWSFGDATYSAATSPTHTYNSAGFFLVTLTGKVPDLGGLDSCLLQDTALVEVPLLPRFEFSSGCFGDPVCFTDKSIFTAGNNITSWSWNFGDASTSSIQSPCHTYASPGTYLVTLTIANASCITSWVDTVVVAPGPTANFTNGSLCSGTATNFTDSSFSGINSWNWSFGNGGTSLNQTPSTTYTAPGTYPVTLIVRDSFGCSDTLNRNVTITAPLASGSITAFPDTVVCAGTDVVLYAPACTSCTYTWSTGATSDSILVAQSGIYSLSITDSNGCIYDTRIYITVNQPPLAVISGPGQHLCLGEPLALQVPYNAMWTYEWISNDSTINGSLSSSIYTIPSSPGVYSYQVVVTDTTTNCNDTSLPWVVNVTSLPAPPVITPLTATTVCEGDTILLTGIHPDSTVSFLWNTGDVTDTILVSEDGCYSLTVTDTNGCKSSATYCVTVNPLPELCAFYEGCYDTCSPFTIPGPPGNASYQWLLNGMPITGATSQNYTASVSGIYSLIVTNDFGCTDTTGEIDLTLYNCPDSLCSGMLVDSIYCDPLTGDYYMDFLVINQSSHLISEVNLQILPPMLSTAYAPNLFYDTVAPGDTSSGFSTVILNGIAGNELCFRTHVSAFDSLGEEIMCCYSDTICVTLPPCQVDTACCELDILSTSISCKEGPAGNTIYDFSFKAEGCGNLFIYPTTNGSVSLTNPLVMPGGLTNINGTWMPSNPNDSTMCLLFLVNNNQGFCFDTLICFDLPKCEEDTLCCYFDIISDTITCAQVAGGSVYHFSITAEGCGTLNISPNANGEFSLNGPVIMSGNLVTLDGIWIPSNPMDTVLCLLFQVHDSLTYCTDTIICFDLPDCSPPITVTGGCCLPDGTCINTTAQDCRQECGHWLGLGSDCSTSLCPVKDTLIGHVNYGNVNKTPLPGVEIILTNITKPPCGHVVISDPVGDFSIADFPGLYHIGASSQISWPFGAANSLDALLIARHFVYLDTLPGLKAAAADVNGSGSVNATDAFQLMRRFVGHISSFAGGDWVFSDTMINLTGGSNEMAWLKGLVFGDVNASYIPTKSSGISISRAGFVSPGQDGRIVLPFTIDRDISLAAFSLDLILPQGIESVSGLEFFSDAGQIEWNVVDNRLRIAWYSLEEWHWNKGEPIFSLELNVPNGIEAISTEDMEVGIASVAANLNTEIQSFDLTVPAIVLEYPGLKLDYVKPNPFTDNMELDFYLPEEGEVRLEVFSAIGQRIAILEDGELQQGWHTSSFSCSNCEQGIYYFRITYDSGNKIESLSRNAILIR